MKRSLFALIAPPLLVAVSATLVFSQRSSDVGTGIAVILVGLMTASVFATALSRCIADSASAPPGVGANSDNTTDRIIHRIANPFPHDTQATSRKRKVASEDS